MYGNKTLIEKIYQKTILGMDRKIAPILYPSIPFIPEAKTKFEFIVSTFSAWQGLEEIIPAILKQFNIPKNTCLEFGVEHGYSTAIFAQLFGQVTGVDTFEGDVHADYKDSFQLARENLKSFQNVTLVKKSYQEFIKHHDRQYDLCHVDIIHTFKDTYACGDWAARHCKCVLFHDTMSFPQVRRAVFALAKKHGKKFYNYSLHYGLGILI